jgi:hypothetical protein
MAEPLKQDTLSMESLSAKFSIAASILKSDPSLLQALYQIMGMNKTGKKKIGPQITDPALQKQILMQTPWFAKNTDDYRAYQFAKESNPTTFAADLKKNAEAIVTAYVTAGVKITAQEAIDLAQQVMMKSTMVNGKVVTFDTNYLKKVIAGSIDFSKTKNINGITIFDVAGQAETITQQLYQKALDFGYTTSVSKEGFSKWMENSVRGIMGGTMNITDVDNEMQKQAQSMFPGLATQIQSGKTLREAADPWLTAIANTWELNPKDIDLNDPTVQSVLNFQDEKGNVIPMNLMQAKTAARRNKEKWQYTGQAKEEYTNIGQKILQDFGFLG